MFSLHLSPKFLSNFQAVSVITSNSLKMPSCFSCLGPLCWAYIVILASQDETTAFSLEPPPLCSWLTYVCSLSPGPRFLTSYSGLGTFFWHFDTQHFRHTLTSCLTARFTGSLRFVPHHNHKYRLRCPFQSQVSAWRWQILPLIAPCVPSSKFPILEFSSETFSSETSGYPPSLALNACLVS